MNTNIYFQTVWERGLWSKAICNQSFFFSFLHFQKISPMPNQLSILPLKEAPGNYSSAKVQGSLCGCVWKKQNAHFHLCIWVHSHYTRTWDFSTKTGRQGLFFHHTFKSELSLQAWHEQLALGFTHLFLKNPGALSKYSHFITNFTRECTLMVVHIYIFVHLAVLLLEGKKKKCGSKKSLLPGKVKI